MTMILAAACEMCAKEPLGWPEAIMWIGVALAAAWFFTTAIKQLG